MDSGRSGREPIIRAGVSHISIHIPDKANKYQAAGMINSQERSGVTDNTAPKAKRKKAKPTPTPDSNRPIPQPYLALAPRPLSSQARQEPSNPNLVLPSYLLLLQSELGLVLVQAPDLRRGGDGLID